MSIEDDDDFLNAARRERGALPAGEYAAEIVPGSVVPFATTQTIGCTVGVKIGKGDYCGRVIRLRFLEGGPESIDGMLARDIEALASWQKAVRAGPSSRQDGIGGVLKAIWKASKGKNVFLRLTTNAGKGGVIETILVAARCDDVV